MKNYESQSRINVSQFKKQDATTLMKPDYHILVKSN